MVSQGEADSIELKGNLMLIYKRNATQNMILDSLNMVLKGYWKEPR